MYDVAMCSFDIVRPTCLRLNIYIYIHTYLLDAGVIGVCCHTHRVRG